MLKGVVVKPVAPPRRKRREVKNGDPAPAGSRSNSSSPSKQPGSISCTSGGDGSPEMKIDSNSTARYTDVTTAKPKPARPEPPKFRGEPPKKQGHRPIGPSPSAPLATTFKVLSPSSTSDSPTTVKKVTFSTPSSPASFEKQSDQNSSLAHYYGKNDAAPQRRGRKSARSKEEDEPENSPMTIINSRQHPESGSYINVAPPPPAKTDNGGPRSRSDRKHSERLQEPVKMKKEVDPAVAKKSTSLKSTQRNGGSIKLKGITSSLSQVLVPSKQSLRKNFTMQPLPPSTKGHGKRLVPVRPAPPAPNKQKATSANRNCRSVGGEEEAKYEYVDPSRIRRYPGAMQSTAGVRLSRDLDGLDLTIYSVINDPPVSDFGKSTSENVYEVINPHAVTEDVYTVPEPLSVVRANNSPSNVVTDLSSCASEGAESRGQGYANLQFHKSRSFTLDTSTGGHGSPSPTSPYPGQEEEGGGNSSEEENIYTPMSLATLDSSPVYEVVKCGRNNSL